MKIIIVCLLLFSSSAFASEPIVWLNSVVSLNRTLSANDFNKLSLNSVISSGVLQPTGTISQIDGLSNHQLRTQLLGFEQSYLLKQLPITDIFWSGTGGKIKVFKLNAYLGITYSVAIQSYNTLLTQDVSSLFVNLMDTYAKIRTGDGNGIQFRVIKIANISNPFKSVSYKKMTSGIIQLLGEKGIVTSPPATLNIDINITKTSCYLTLKSNSIDFGNVTDSALNAGIVNKPLKISSSCSNAGISYVSVQLLNTNNGIIYSSDNAIGFKLYDDNNNLLTNEFTMDPDVTDYNINVVAFSNKPNDIYGNHHGSLNIKFTYK